MTLSFKSLYSLENERKSNCDYPEYTFDPVHDVPFCWGSPIDGVPFIVPTMWETLERLRTRWSSIDVVEVNRIHYQQWNDTCLAQNPILVARFKDDPDAAFHFKLWVETPPVGYLEMLRESLSA